MSISTESKLVFGALLVGAIGYGVYFDYQRRNNPAFRKKLQKQRKEAAKLKRATKQQATAAIGLEDEPLPTTNEEREKYFMSNLQAGEMLMQQGPMAFDRAAAHFYKALQVYPEPQKLLEVLAQSLPEPVLQLILQKMAQDVQASQLSAAKVEELE
ncbi:protein import receptor MAS20 [Globomyces pollinis-pini]|nr:protein import receptor MAS20 [Globomyces pollinis-pini]KAJ2993380.1 hypothetical protein HDV02_002457 [Globomyces sp. JEL0801]